MFFLKIRTVLLECLTKGRGHIQKTHLLGCVKMSDIIYIIFLRYQQGRVSVAQEPEIMSKGIVVNLVPVAVDECRDEQ